MIVRAKTPQRLSLAGRLAIVALAALLLPLAPSWGQRDSSRTGPDLSDRPLREANATHIVGLKAEITKLNAEIDKKRAELEARSDTGSTATLNDELVILLETRDSVTEELLRLAFDAKPQPARDEEAKLKAYQQRLGQLAYLKEAQPVPDEKAKAKSDDGREAAERVETQLKELVEKLGKDVSPVAQRSGRRSSGPWTRSIGRSGRKG